MFVMSNECVMCNSSDGFLGHYSAGFDPAAAEFRRLHGHVAFTQRYTAASYLETLLVLLRFQIFCRRSVSVGFARKTAVFGSVSVLIINAL